MESWMEPGFTKRGRGRMGIMGSTGTWLGVAFAVLGIITEATTTTIIGINPMSWYFLSIAALIFGLSCWLGWAVGMYLHLKETQSKKEE